jgi:hypothetical protein
MRGGDETNYEISLENASDLSGGFRSEELER